MAGDNLQSLPSAALRAYEQLLTFEHGTTAKWSALSGSLRAEAELHTGDQRTKRLDRAEDCEARANRAALNGGAL